MRINEIGLGSNYHTKDNSPISRFNDDRISVEIFPSAFGDSNAQVKCDLLNYNSGLRKFSTEQEATLFATNVYDEIIGKLNTLEERIIKRLLRV